jgi:hypothetical protein
MQGIYDISPPHKGLYTAYVSAHLTSNGVVVTNEPHLAALRPGETPYDGRDARRGDLLYRLGAKWYMIDITVSSETGSIENPLTQAWQRKIKKYSDDIANYQGDVDGPLTVIPMV